MKVIDESRKEYSWLLISLMIFLGIGAFGGGATLILSPDGKLLGLPLSILSLSPFRNFLIPGIILFLILGVVPLLLVYALIAKPISKYAELINIFSDMHWAWGYSIYTSFALIIWLQVEMSYVGVHWLHSFYMMFAIILIIVLTIPGNKKYYNKVI